VKRTIYLSHDLANQVDDYLRLHPGMTLSSLVQEALQERVAPRDFGALLELAGFVTDVRPSTAHQPEDQVVDHAR
jgi:hypothetical protein